MEIRQDGDFTTSRADETGYLDYLKANPNVKTFIYTHNGNYSEYDNKGTFGFRSKSNEATIFGKKK